MEFKEILIPPKEGISSIHFNPNDNNIISTTTWFGSLRSYSIINNNCIFEANFEKPVLCSCWLNNNLVAGLSDGGLFLSDGTKVGSHINGVSSIGSFDDSILYSTSWDGEISAWDVRECKKIFGIDTEERILAGNHSECNIIACSHKNHTYLLDYRNPESIIKRVSSLQQQIRCVAPSKPEKDSWATASIDGRISIEYFGDIKQQAQRFAFSGHKVESSERIDVYPINSMCYHPTNGNLFSGCSNGRVICWDLKQKRKVFELPKQYETSISSMDFNSDGSILAVSSSYMWDKGQCEYPNDKLEIIMFSQEIQE